MPAPYVSRSTGLIHRVDFTGQSSGGLTAAQIRALGGGGWIFSRASKATVQTGTANVVLGLLNDVCGMGRALTSDSLGLVLDESRINQSQGSHDYTGWTSGTGTLTSGYTTAGFGPDGATYPSRYQCSSTQFGIYSSAIFSASAPFSAQFWSWARATSGTNAPAMGEHALTSGVRVYSPTTLGTTFQIIELGTVGALSGETLNCQLCTGTDVSAYGGPTARAVDCLWWASQVEKGLFRTELIENPSGTNTSRAAFRFYQPVGSWLTWNGRLELRIRGQFKGSTTDYSSAPTLINVAGGTIVTISNSTGKITVTVNGGTPYTTASGLTWSKGWFYDIRIMFGGGSMQTVVKMETAATLAGLSGTMTTLGSSSSPQPAIPNGALDLFQDSTGANALSHRLYLVEAYSPGTLATLAA